MKNGLNWRQFGGNFSLKIIISSSKGNYGIKCACATQKLIAMALSLRDIFRCMMEDRLSPIYKDSHIIFGIEDNLAVVEYEEKVLSIRLFFSIDAEACNLFLEASNSMMLTTDIVKAVVLDDRTNIMFSCEMMCDTVKEFKKFFPRAVEYIKEAVIEHKREMKRLIISPDILSGNIAGADEAAPHNTKRKPLS